MGSLNKVLKTTRDGFKTVTSREGWDAFGTIVKREMKGRNGKLKKRVKGELIISNMGGEAFELQMGGLRQRQ